MTHRRRLKPNGLTWEQAQEKVRREAREVLAYDRSPSQLLADAKEYPVEVYHSPAMAFIWLEDPLLAQEIVAKCEFSFFQDWFPMSVRFALEGMGEDIWPKMVAESMGELRDTRHAADVVDYAAVQIHSDTERACVFVLRQCIERALSKRAGEQVPYWDSRVTFATMRALGRMMGLPQDNFTPNRRRRRGR